VVPRGNKHVLRLGATHADRVQLKVRHRIGGRKDEGNRPAVERRVRGERLVRGRFGSPTDCTRET
jgi:hypothetical protein